MLDPLPGPPRHIGPYRLFALIGAGGMGEVYLAREHRAGAPLVAVKTVRADLDVDREFRIRFRREIAAARAVSGPGTAALLDGDADARVPWLATEYVPGPALAETVARCGPLPVPVVRALGARLARALAAVHAAHVLHRDLKPGNVLLTPEGPKLIDFGIAQAFEATALTAAGMVVGTPGFMAPEQIEGSHAVVPASDVFALGAVLCHAATGRGPFDDPELASVVFRITRGTRTCRRSRRRCATRSPRVCGWRRGSGPARRSSRGGSTRVPPTPGCPGPPRCSRSSPSIGRPSPAANRTWPHGRSRRPTRRRGPGPRRPPHP